MEKIKNLLFLFYDVLLKKRYGMYEDKPTNVKEQEAKLKVDDLLSETLEEDDLDQEIIQETADRKTSTLVNFARVKNRRTWAMFIFNMFRDTNQVYANGSILIILGIMFISLYLAVLRKAILVTHNGFGYLFLVFGLFLIILGVMFYDAGRFKKSNQCDDCGMDFAYKKSVDDAKKCWYCHKAKA
jgi:hypothetical protein